jgi:cobalt-zinc-cadmium efflux system outer membrane protein
MSAAPDPVRLAEVNSLVNERTGAPFDSAGLLAVEPAASAVPPAPPTPPTPPTPPAAPLTLDDAVAAALARNLSLTAGAETLAIAQAQLAQAGLLQNPTVGQSSGFIFPFRPSAGPFTFDINFTQQLNTFWTRGARLSVADAQRTQAGVDLAAQAFDVSQLVRSKYQEIGHLLRSRRIADEVKTLYGRTLAAAEARAKVGVVPVPEVNRARLQVRDAERQIRQLDVQFRRAKSELNFLMGRSDAPDWTLPAEVGEPPRDVPAAPDGSLEELAARFRLDLRHAELDRQIAEANLRLADLGLIPTIVAGGEFIYTNTSAFPGGGSGGNSVWTGGPWLVGITLPIFDPGVVAVELAKAQVRKAAKTHRALDGQVRQDVRTALYNLNAARENVLFYRDDFLPQQRENVRLAELSFQNGASDLDSLLNIQRDYRTALQAFEDFVQAYQDASVALQRAAGLAWPRLMEEARRGSGPAPAM